MKTITINSEEVKSQADAILWHLKTYGTITSYEAIKEYGATRLSAITPAGSTTQISAFS